MKSEFYSKGKLLLTAEYVVLDGAKALALPTKKGQSLHAEKNDSGILNWSSFNCHDQIWYKTQLKTSLLFKRRVKCWSFNYCWVFETSSCIKNRSSSFCGSNIITTASKTDI